MFEYFMTYGVKADNLPENINELIDEVIIQLRGLGIEAEYSGSTDKISRTGEYYFIGSISDNSPTQALVTYATSLRLSLAKANLIFQINMIIWDEFMGESREIRPLKCA